MKYFLILLSITLLFSQEKRLHNHPSEFQNSNSRSNSKKQRMENMMIWRLTDKLELTVEQSESFFPQFRQFREDIKKMNDEERGIGDNVQKDLSDNRTFSKTGVKNIQERYFKIQKLKIDIRKEFLLNVENILSPKQIAILTVFKQEMMRDMKNELKDYKGKKRLNKKKSRF